SGPGLIAENSVWSGATDIRANKDCALVVVLAPPDVALGKLARRISGRLCAIGNLLAEHNVAWLHRSQQHTGRYPRKTQSGEGRARLCLGHCAGGDGDIGESLRIQTARSHLPISLQPLPDGPH